MTLREKLRSGVRKSTLASCCVMVLPPSTTRPWRKFCVGGARDAPDVDPEVRVEARVLHRDDRVAEGRGDLLEGHEDALFRLELDEELVVVGVDAAPQARARTPPGPSPGAGRRARTRTRRPRLRRRRGSRGRAAASRIHRTTRHGGTRATGGRAPPAAAGRRARARPRGATAAVEACGHDGADLPWSLGNAPIIPSGVVAAPRVSVGCEGLGPVLQPSRHGLVPARRRAARADPPRHRRDRQRGGSPGQARARAARRRVAPGQGRLRPDRAGPPSRPHRRDPEDAAVPGPRPHGLLRDRRLHGAHRRSRRASPRRGRPSRARRSRPTPRPTGTRSSRSSIRSGPASCSTPRGSPRSGRRTSSA